MAAVPSLLTGKLDELTTHLTEAEDRRAECALEISQVKAAILADTPYYARVALLRALAPAVDRLRLVDNTVLKLREAIERLPYAQGA